MCCIPLSCVISLLLQQFRETFVGDRVSLEYVSLILGQYSDFRTSVLVYILSTARAKDFRLCQSVLERASFH